MPDSGIPIDTLNGLEDAMARLIQAQQQVDALRLFARLVRDRGWVTEPYYRDIVDALAAIEAGLLVGKRNTAALMRAGKDKAK